MTVLQYQGLGSVALTLTDIVTLADLGTTLATLTPGEIAALAGNGIDVINATDNALSLTVAQYLNLGAVNLTGGDTVILRDTGAHIAGLSPAALAALAANGIDRLDASDNSIVFNLAQAQSLDSSQLSPTTPSHQWHRSRRDDQRFRLQRQSSAPAPATTRSTRGPATTFSPAAPGATS